MPEFPYRVCMCAVCVHVCVRTRTLASARNPIDKPRHRRCKEKVEERRSSKEEEEEETQAV